MREFTVTTKEAGLSVIKFARRLFPQAPNSLLYKFIRNKNIELNGKKTPPDAVLREGDKLAFFLSEETYGKFRGLAESGGEEGVLAARETSGSRTDFASLIIYEDEHIILLNKPAGLLSQGGRAGETSLNEELLRYLGYSAAASLIKPSVCNRLDKNTSGLIAAGKSAEGLRCLNLLFAERTVQKRYLAIVVGRTELNGLYSAYLRKDKQSNLASVSAAPKEGYAPIETYFFTKEVFNRGEFELSLVEAELVTGKPHQIRAQLNFLGFPVLGDRKYCTDGSLKALRSLGISRQLLHSLSLIFPKIDGTLSYLSCRSFTTEVPGDFERVRKNF